MTHAFFAIEPASRLYIQADRQYYRNYMIAGLFALRE